MKIEKINENKIKITLSARDLQERNLDFQALRYNSPEAQHLFWDMIKKAESEHGFSASNCQLFIEAASIMDGNFIVTITKMTDGRALPNIPFVKSKAPLSSIIHFIENNLSDNSISNTSLAQKAGISEVYLRKLFISNLGITPKQYILDLRLKKAKQLLTDTNHTVTTISEKCGFTSPYHFSRIFKEKTGVTPTQYLKEHRKSKI
jgi:AraC-like DNA-binding protein